MSAEGTARAVKPSSSFQCTGIHHAVRARTYKGDEHLAYALNNSMASLPLPKMQVSLLGVLHVLASLGGLRGPLCAYGAGELHVLGGIQRVGLLPLVCVQPKYCARSAHIELVFNISSK